MNFYLCFDIRFVQKFHLKFREKALCQLKKSIFTCVTLTFSQNALLEGVVGDSWWEAKTTSLEKECGTLCPLHTPYFVMMPYSNKKSFSPLLIESSLCGLFLPANVRVIYVTLLLLYDACL